MVHSVYRTNGTVIVILCSDDYCVSSQPSLPLTHPGRPASISWLYP